MSFDGLFSYNTDPDQTLNCSLFYQVKGHMKDTIKIKAVCWIKNHDNMCHTMHPETILPNITLPMIIWSSTGAENL